jgi:hypothetical protein
VGIVPGVRRAVLAAFSASALLALASCGGDQGGAASDGVGLVPGSASFVVILDTDFEGDQWESVDELVKKFPGGREGFRGLLELQDEVDFESDVEPALGPETVVAVLDSDGDEAVILTEPDDPAKFTELASSGDPWVTRELDDGWWAAAESEEILDGFDQARDEGSIDESDGWEDATEDLPEDALATIYTPGVPLEAALGQSDVPPEAQGVADCLAGGSESPAAAFAVVAEEDGIRVEGASRKPEELPEPEEGESELADRVPGSAFGFASFRGLGEYIREGIRCATEANDELAMQLAQLELGLGLSLEEDILPLLDGETAVALFGRSGDQPVSGLVATEVEDDAEALETIDQILERARLFEPSLAVEEATIEGLDARRVVVDGEVMVTYAAADGVLGFATQEEALAGLADQEAPLSEDEEYRATRDAAGAPDETAGFVYMDTQRMLDLFLAAIGPNLPVDLGANLEPLRSLLFWSEIDGDEVSVEGLFRID